jgi:hypothetical protein
MDKVKYLLFVEPTRWAELLLGLIKFCLGFNLMAYLWDPPKTSSAIDIPLAFLIGSVILTLGVSQIVLVMVESRWPRFIVCCLATGMWISFMGLQFLASGSLRTILIYIPLLIFNIIVALRISRGRA